MFFSQRVQTVIVIRRLELCHIRTAHQPCQLLTVTELIAKD